MNIKSGKIKNINKKIFAGVLCLVLLTPTFVSCTTTDINEVNYSMNKDGSVIGINGTVSYDVIKECEIYKVTDKESLSTFYVIALFERGWFDTYLYDIFTKEDYTNRRFILNEKLKSLEYYLNEFDMVKDEYTEEELKNILDQFYDKYSNLKVKVKK